MSIESYYDGRCPRIPYPYLSIAISNSEDVWISPTPSEDGDKGGIVRGGPRVGKRSGFQVPDEDGLVCWCECSSSTVSGSTFSGRGFLAIGSRRRGVPDDVGICRTYLAEGFRVLEFPNELLTPSANGFLTRFTYK